MCVMKTICSLSGSVAVVTNLRTELPFSTKLTSRFLQSSVEKMRGCQLPSSSLVRELRQQGRWRLRKPRLALDLFREGKSRKTSGTRVAKTSLKSELDLLQTLFANFSRFESVWMFRKRTRKSFSCVHVLDKTWNWAFSCHSRAVTAKKKKKNGRGKDLNILPCASLKWFVSWLFWIQMSAHFKTMLRNEES